MLVYLHCMYNIIDSKQQITFCRSSSSVETSPSSSVFLSFNELMDKVVKFVGERGIMVGVTLILLHFLTNSF